MKKNIVLTIFLICASFQTQPHQLVNPLLKAADNAGLFNAPLYRILTVRKTIKDFISGKLMWSGIESNLVIVDDNNNKLSSTLRIIHRRPEAILGATFIVLSPDHPNLFDFITPEQQLSVRQFVQNITQKTLLHRYENINYHAVATGTYALHPLSGQKLKIFVSDYTIEDFDTRVTHAHMAIPAHNAKDFAFAHEHNQTIKQVITSAPNSNNAANPQIDKKSGKLVCAYTAEFEDSMVINSDFINGSIMNAIPKVINKLKNLQTGNDYNQPILYHVYDQNYSATELQTIESTLNHNNLSPAQKDSLQIAMHQVQADFLSLVEHFLSSIKETKDLMIDLVEESCQLRHNNDSYLLHWACLNTATPARTTFQHDITTFQSFTKFCNDLIDFLGDFASSCPKALKNLKDLKK